MDGPSRANPLKLRSRLALKGYKIPRFAKAFGFKVPTVKAAIAGKRGGPISQMIISRIIEL